MNRAAYVLALPVLALLACGQEEADLDGDGDTTNENDDEDTAVYGSAFEPDSVEALYYEGDNPVWVLTAKEGETWLYLENYPSFGGASGAETRTIDDTEASYATCGVCILLKTGCQQHGDHGHCETTYMPEIGASVTFDELGDEVGSSWTGSLSPIRFIEVSIDSASYETTPVSDGDTIDLDAWDFDVVLEEG